MTSVSRRLLAASVVLAAGAVALTGCALIPLNVSPRTTTEHDVSDAVHGLLLETSANVEIVLGDTPGLELTGPEAELERVTLDERDGVLVIGHTGPGFMLRNVSATLTVATFDHVVVEGAGDVVADFAQADDVAITVRGAGNVTAHGIDAGDVEVRIEGAGDVSTAGTARTAHLTITGAGNIDAFGLTVEGAVAEIDGAGDIKVFATREVEARSSGVGDIRIRGGADVTREVSGVGDIIEE